MKKKVKVTLITLGSLAALVIIGLVSLCVVAYMMYMDPDAQSFSELFHDCFIGKETKYEVYPFDITCVDTLFYSSSNDYVVEYTDTTNVPDERVAGIYINLSGCQSDYDTIQTIYTMLRQCTNTDERQQCVESARTFKRKIVFCNTANPDFRYWLDTEDNIEKKLADYDKVTYY